MSTKQNQWYMVFTVWLRSKLPCTIHPPCLTFWILFRCINTNNAIICVEAKTIYVKRISVNIFNFIHIECKQMMFLRADKKRMYKTQTANIWIADYTYTTIHIYMNWACIQCMKRVERFAITFQLFVCRMVDGVYAILHSQTPNTLLVVYSPFYEMWIVNRHSNTLIHHSYEYV